MISEIPYSQARKRLGSLMDQVADTREPLLIRRRDKEPVALIAADELVGWFETAHLLRSQKNARRLLEASARAARGEGRAMDVDELGRQLDLGYP